MEQLLSEHDYAKILQERFKNSDTQYISSEWAPLSENVEGFMGDHYILKITYKLDNEQHTENFFIKSTPNKTDLQKEMASKFKAYQKETFLYDFLFREYEKMGYYTSFAPKAYYCKNGETLVMEDLMSKGFKLKERRDFYDLEHCKLALKALAYYHANSISYEEEKSKKTGKEYRLGEEYQDVFEEILYKAGCKDSMGSKYIQTAIDSFKKIVDALPQTEQWKKAFLTKLDNFDATEIFLKDLPYRKATTHGDLWCNNMLFKYCNEVPTQCCLFDYQALRQHHLSFDVLLLIYSNTLKPFRKIHLENLIQFYYSTFEAIMEENGFSASNILSWDQFMESLHYFKPIAVVQALAGRTLTIMPTDIINSAMESDGELENIMFEDRPTSIMKAFNKDEEYRKILREDLVDLYECLCIDSV